MPIPRYDEIQYPVLCHLADGVVVKKSEFDAPLADHFKLTDEERTQEYPSKNGAIFHDRISWALSYLAMAGLVDRPKRGYYQINGQGRQFLDDPDGMRAEVNRRIAEREAAAKQAKAAENTQATGNETDTTPQEALYSAAEKIRANICDDILSTILGKTPRAFEHLVAQLLHRMGYGGGISDAGKVTQYSNDGGIDGVIKEDILGLGRIHIQAKRYDHDITIGREAIQNFVGALAVAQSNKGVFITTSSFSKPAIDYVATLNGQTTVVLIDGQQLARYIYEHGLGMQDEQTIVIKKLDGDFWDQFPDDTATDNEN